MHTSQDIAATQDSAALARRLCPDVAWCQGQRGRTPQFLLGIAREEMKAQGFQVPGAGPVPEAPRGPQEEPTPGP